MSRLYLSQKLLKKEIKNMREYRLITFCCRECGNIVRVLINKNKLTFEIIGKNYSEKDVLTESGYFRCLETKNETNVRFEFIYS